MLNLTDLFFSFQIAVLAYVFTCILIEPDNILERYGDFLESRKTKLGKYLAKPFGLCEKCLAGQLATWIYAILGYDTFIIITFTGVLEEILKHVIFIAFTIFFTKYLKTISEWTKRR